MTIHQFRIWGTALCVIAVVGVGACKSGPTALDYVGDARDAYEKDRYAEASTFLDLAEEKGAPEHQVQKMRAKIARSRALRTLEAGKDREAFDEFIDAAEIDPRPRASSQTFLRALEIGRRLGMPREKLAAVAQKAVDADPSSVRARRHAGQLWEAAGQPEKAVDAYLWVWQSDRSFTNIGRRLAVVYEKLEQTDDAVAILKQVLDEEPDDAQAAMKLAKLYADSGRPRLARERYEKLLEQYPDKPGVLLRYARFLEQHGERSRAKRLKERAYEQMPGQKQRKMRDLQ